MIDEEVAPPEEEQMKDLLALVESFRERISELGFSPEFLAFLNEQLEVIERAVRDSIIFGPIAFAVATRTLKGQIVTSMLPGQGSLRDEANTDQGRKAFSMIAQLWDKMVKYGDKTGKVTRLLTGPSQVLDVIDKLTDSFGG